MTRRRALALSWGLLGAVVVVALAIGTMSSPEPTPAERVLHLSEQFACPTCAGQSVRYSDAGISTQIRVVIAQGVEEGKTDDQILSELVQAYGPEYLLTPSASGAASLAWALPVFLAVLAVAGLAAAFWRWRPTRGEVTDDERAAVERAMRAGDPDS
ncbi:MAG: cytochrome c-type biogenesis protein CcmH [Acidimicrobiales bacterium]|nr:cytochrome c-type biogenesis protein CcmH [Acidimicrobiales bacterium]